MKAQLIKPTLEALDEVHSDSLCLFLFEDVRPLAGLAGLVDWRLGAYISRHLEKGWLTGGSGERFIIPARHKLQVNKVFGFGLGPVESFDPALQHALVLDAFRVLARAGAHGTILTGPGRAEGLASDMDSLEAVCKALDPSYDFDEVVIVDNFRRIQDAYRKLDLYLKPLADGP
jgi:hypothetical protein